MLIELKSRIIADKARQQLESDAHDKATAARGQRATTSLEGNNGATVVADRRRQQPFTDTDDRPPPASLSPPTPPYLSRSSREFEQHTATRRQPTRESAAHERHASRGRGHEGGATAGGATAGGATAPRGDGPAMVGQEDPQDPVPSRIPSNGFGSAAPATSRPTLRPFILPSLGSTVDAAGRRATLPALPFGAAAAVAGVKAPAVEMEEVGQPCAEAAQERLGGAQTDAFIDNQTAIMQGAAAGETVTSIEPDPQPVNDVLDTGGAEADSTGTLDVGTEVVSAATDVRSADEELKLGTLALATQLDAQVDRSNDTPLPAVDQQEKVAGNGGDSLGHRLRQLLDSRDGEADTADEDASKSVDAEPATPCGDSLGHRLRQLLDSRGGEADTADEDASKSVDVEPAAIRSATPLLASEPVDGAGSESAARALLSFATALAVSFA